MRMIYKNITKRKYRKLLKDENIKDFFYISCRTFWYIIYAFNINLKNDITMYIKWQESRYYIRFMENVIHRKKNEM